MKPWLDIGRPDGTLAILLSSDPPVETGGYYISPAVPTAGNPDGTWNSLGITHI